MLSQTMKPETQEIIQDTVKIPKPGNIVEGTVIGTGRSAVYIDIKGSRPAIIYGREFIAAKNVLKNIQKGTMIRGKVVSPENKEGYIEISIRDAQDFYSWDKLDELKNKKETTKARITGANKGGLLTTVLGVPAFLPVSQLSAKNYPKVDDKDSEKILRKLQELVGKDLDVKVIDVSKRENKLIVSEKATTQEVTEILKKYKIGDVIKGEITEVTNFGAFIKFPHPDLEYEGLIHISELDWKMVRNPADIAKTGEIVDAQIVNINDDGRIFLSLKALKERPARTVKPKAKESEKTPEAAAQ